MTWDVEGTDPDGPLNMGVIGVGSMGRHHARIYSQLPDVSLVGVADADPDVAATVADDYGTRAINSQTLLRAADAVSVAVPTRYHGSVATEAIDEGCHVLVEKPIASDPSEAENILSRARKAGRVLQVGHVERFNPAIETLGTVLPEGEVLAVDARRLGPPVDRDIEVSTVYDLMIHDIDVLRSIVDAEVNDVSADTVPGEPHVSARVTFENGVLGTLTASRVTQQKVRELSVTCRECQINVDYLSPSVTVHRHSLPEYVERDGDLRYRSESVVERPRVGDGEPLRRELEAFVEAIRQGTAPPVTGEDGLRALELARRIDDDAGDTRVPASQRAEQ